MPDRIVGGKVILDQRKSISIEPIKEAAEPFLQRLYPGIWQQAESDIDQILRLMYDGVWRDYCDEIEADIHAFVDSHPVDEHRTEPAIKAWSQQCGEKLEGEYSQSYYRVAVHVGLVAYVNQMRELRRKMSCDQGWHRIVERFHDACALSTGFGFLGAHEKWGGLRITYRCDQVATEACREAERVAIEHAAVTCETCGQPGKLRQTAWRKTLCDEHAGSRYND
ncbi:hypothetical protein [uncultured Agrobacterium sp.]|uniref:hypothetical protein n=1 Tax=uncultured Agrobacterium sp. TaxID=157277 RepID=UPI0025881E90|nr:hypothetical protein [uncultured Agrobacterium sp.]